MVPQSGRACSKRNLLTANFGSVVPVRKRTESALCLRSTSSFGVTTPHLRCALARFDLQLLLVMNTFRPFYLGFNIFVATMNSTVSNCCDPSSCLLGFLLCPQSVSLNSVILLLLPSFEFGDHIFATGQMLNRFPGVSHGTVAYPLHLLPLCNTSCCANSNNFFWLINVFAGRRVESALRSALLRRAFRFVRSVLRRRIR
mmetsp:Transcript_49545/g.123175  ORF Transcript_49545/g.123175 Transcript_49545/m.123175 type:complete len:200 (+) Transcript_49545:388-987(+)